MSPQLPELRCPVCNEVVLRGNRFTIPPAELVRLPNGDYAHTWCEETIIPPHWMAL